MENLPPMPVLETDRLRLSYFQESDLDNLYRIESDAAVMKFIRKPHTDPAKSLERIRQEMTYAAEFHGLGLFACIEKATDTYLGLVKIKHLENTDAIEIGYAFVPEVWGKGYATEVTLQAVAYLQRSFKGRKIVAFVQKENDGSIRVMEKTGMIQVSNVYERPEDVLTFEMP